MFLRLAAENQSDYLGNIDKIRTENSYKIMKVKINSIIN